MCGGLYGANSEVAGGMVQRGALWRETLAGIYRRNATELQLQQLLVDLSLALVQAGSVSLNMTTIAPPSTTSTTTLLPAACGMLADGQVFFDADSLAGNHSRTREGIRCVCSLATNQAVRQGVMNLASASFVYFLTGGSPRHFQSWAVQEFRLMTNVTLSPQDATTLTAVALTLYELLPDIQEAVNATMQADASGG